MNLPVAGEEGVYIFSSEVVRRAMGAIGDVQFPGFADGRFQFGRKGCQTGWLRIRQGQHIAGPQGATTMAAELAQGKGAAGGQVFRAVQPTAE